MARLREKVAEVLGIETSNYGGVPCYVDKSEGFPGVSFRLPDPEDIAVVWRLRELAIEKDSHGFADAMFAATHAATYSEGHGRERVVAIASADSIRTAALSVLLGVTIEEVRGWS